MHKLSRRYRRRMRGTGLYPFRLPQNGLFQGRWILLSHAEWKRFRLQSLAEMGEGIADEIRARMNRRGFMRRYMERVA